MKFVFFILIAALFSCTTQKITKIQKRDQNADTAKALGGAKYVSIEFRKGAATLTKDSKRKLKSFIKNLNKEKRDVEEIKILAWADTEYPLKTQRTLPTNEIVIAKERGESIKTYLEKDLKTEEDIDAYNMARRPNLVSKLFKNDEYILKEAFEKTEEKNMPLSRASKALVIIDFEGNEKTK